jgi:DNA-directed RNA polymerase subunit M
MLKPKEERGKKFLACACGYSSKTAAKVTEAGQKKEQIEVMSEMDTTLPLTDEHCPVCNHPRAFWWTKQMRASDEPETKFLRCEQCKHTWRDRS